MPELGVIIGKCAHGIFEVWLWPGKVVDVVAELVEEVGVIHFGGFLAEFANAFEDGFFGEGFEEAECAGEEGLVGICFLEFGFGRFDFCRLGCVEFSVAGEEFVDELDKFSVVVEGLMKLDFGVAAGQRGGVDGGMEVNL